MQKVTINAIAPIARIIPKARPAFAPVVMLSELEDVKSWEELIELEADNALIDVDDEDPIV
jgi:hypothetical protein